MPKSSNSKVKSKFSRSRNGCSECKKRRKACDETKPKCSRCNSMGINCLYKVSLKFKEDFESKGAAFGREGVWSKNTVNDLKTTDLTLIAARTPYLQNYKYPGDLHFINLSTSTFNAIPRTIRHTIIPKTSYPFVDDQTVNFALSYYLENISPIFNPNKSGSHDGPLDLGTIVQYSHQGAIYAFHLLVAIGSCHLAQNQGSRFWFERAHFHKQQAAKDLKQRIESNDVSPRVYELLLYTLLQCIFDLANNGHDDWSDRMRMAGWLLSKTENCPSNDVERKIVDFSVDFFGYQEAMGRTACRKRSMFDTESWNVDNSLIPWMGCNRKLVSVISDITDLSYERTNSDLQKSEYKILTDRIEFELNNNEIVKLEESSINDMLFSIGCDCKILATKVYFHCALLNCSPKDKLIKSMIMTLKQSLQILILENRIAWSFLLWPLFIMGSQIDPLDVDCELMRASTLQMLKFLTPKSLGNANTMKETLLHIWNKRDLAVDLKPSSTPRSNDWETFITKKELNLSLA